MSENNMAAQIFYYIKRDINESVFAFENSEGVTVPFFSEPDLALEFIETARVRSHQVAIISPTQLVDFSEACKRAGAKFLQMDPKVQVLKGARIRDITSRLA